MVKQVMSRISLVVGAAALVACGEQAVGPAATQHVNPVLAGLASRAPSKSVVGGPDLSNHLTFQGEVWICKDGVGPAISFDIDYTVTRIIDNVVVSTGTVAVPLGRCVLAANVSTQISARYQVTATEQLPPANWTLTAIDWAYGATLPGVPGHPVLDLPNRTVSAILVNNDIGVQLTFTNIYTAPPTGEIGDYVWNDVDGDGVQDVGEAGIAGVAVTLSGAASATTTTDANGGYLFSGLAAGSYTVTVSSPLGYSASPSGQGGDPTKDSNGSPASVTLASNSSSDLTIDFGFTTGTGSIGDFVWYDVDGDGIQDVGEAGIAGVTVALSGASNATTTTNASGGYLFSGLSAGSYTVTVTTPSGYVASPSNQGGDPTKDSNGSPASVTLASNNSTDLTIDFGYTKNAGEIGDFVWYDKNSNGIQDWGEPGLAGVTVTLSGAASATTTTSASGAYKFAGLGAGNYTVTVTTPAGFAPSPSNQGGDPSKDSNGSPASVTLATSNSTNYTIDFGYLKPCGVIGNFVWNDKDGDGLQEWGEPGLVGVTVTLSGPVSATTTTNSGGYYLFSGLPAGTYTVTVGTVNGYVTTKTLQGSDRSKDSNVNPSTVILTTNSSSDLTIDFGFKKISIVPCVQPTTHWTGHWYEWDSASDGKVFTKYNTFYKSGVNNWTMITASISNGNAYVILAQELITAQLSRGFYQSTGNASVDAAIAGAEAYFLGAAPGIQYPSGTLRTQLLGWASTLDAWTDGRMATPICTNC